jgi:hypothetical protein
MTVFEMLMYVGGGVLFGIAGGVVAWIILVNLPPRRDRP